jgi:hypothetical protein
MHLRIYLCIYASIYAFTHLFVLLIIILPRQARLGTNTRKALKKRCVFLCVPLRSMTWTTSRRSCRCVAKSKTDRAVFGVCYCLMMDDDVKSSNTCQDRLGTRMRNLEEGGQTALHFRVRLQCDVGYNLCYARVVPCLQSARGQGEMRHDDEKPPPCWLASVFCLLSVFNSTLGHSYEIRSFVKTGSEPR